MLVMATTPDPAVVAELVRTSREVIQRVVVEPVSRWGFPQRDIYR
jgi:hypothetical protein